jgi:hypothetical protein
VIHGELEREFVQKLGRDPRLHMLDEEVQPLRRETACPAHALESLRSVKGSLAMASPVELGGIVLVHHVS